MKHAAPSTPAGPPTYVFVARALVVVRSYPRPRDGCGCSLLLPRVFTPPQLQQQRQSRAPCCHEVFLSWGNLGIKAKRRARASTQQRPPLKAERQAGTLGWLAVDMNPRRSQRLLIIQWFLRSIRVCWVLDIICWPLLSYSTRLFFLLPRGG